MQCKGMSFFWLSINRLRVNSDHLLKTSFLGDDSVINFELLFTLRICDGGGHASFLKVQMQRLNRHTHREEVMAIGSLEIMFSVRILKNGI